MKILDKTELLAKTQRVVTLPQASADAGEDVQVTIRRVSASEYRELIPSPPAISSTWPEKGEARLQAELDWMESLPPAEKIQRRAELLEASAFLVSRSLVEPKMTPEEVKRLGDDALWLFVELMGWMKPAAARPAAPAAAKAPGAERAVAAAPATAAAG